MRKTIWKFNLMITGQQDVLVPEGAVPLSVQEQHGLLCIWFLVDLDSSPVPITLLIVGTGQPLNQTDAKQVEYLGTVQMTSGFVWHVFVRRT